MSIREASHAVAKLALNPEGIADAPFVAWQGSWYSSNSNKLNKELDGWLAAVSGPSGSPLDGTPPIAGYPIKGAKALIGPHAGFSYSGPTAAWAYRCIDTTDIKRVFVLGPSHHAYLDGCATTSCTSYATPIGDLPIDRKTVAELNATGKFEKMSLSVDEAEHSIEMHLPYVRKIFAGYESLLGDTGHKFTLHHRKDIEIVPVLVGSLRTQQEAEYGQVLAPYLADPSTFFVVSSDFCHWGSRFRYTHYANPSGSTSTSSSALSQYPIYESITALDKAGMDHIALSPSSSSSKSARQAHEAFASYLKETKNTICGRHPIGVLLGAVAALQEQGASGWSAREVELKWTKYAQSSQCMRMSDSSVSYASAYLKASGV